MSAATRRRAPLLLSLLLLTLAQLAQSQARPAHAMQLDAVDTCLFTCDYCYKGEVLVQCANTCLQADGQMGIVWQQTCPYFRKNKPLFFF